jgi:hypothetical protein
VPPFIESKFDPVPMLRLTSAQIYNTPPVLTAKLDGLLPVKYLTSPLFTLPPLIISLGDTVEQSIFETGGEGVSHCDQELNILVSSTKIKKEVFI